MPPSSSRAISWISHTGTSVAASKYGMMCASPIDMILPYMSTGSSSIRMVLPSLVLILLREHAARRAVIGGVAKLSGEVADDQADGVSLLLKLAQLAQGHGAPDVQARAGGIDPVLHAQRLTRAQALRHVLAHDHVDHAAPEQLVDLIPIAYGRRRLPGQ